MSCEIFRDVVSNGKTVTKQGSTYSAITWAADHGAVICQNSWSYVVDKDGDKVLSEEEIADALKREIGVLDRLAIDYFIKNAVRQGGEPASGLSDERRSGCVRRRQQQSQQRGSGELCAGRRGRGPRT